VPIRIAIASSSERRTSGKAFAQFADSRLYSESVYSRMENFFESAKFPGLIRTSSTQRAASMAASGLKWMSATRGTEQPAWCSAARMFPRFLASLSVGDRHADDFAADLDEAKRFLHAGRRIHRVARVLTGCGSGCFPRPAVVPIRTSRAGRRPERENRLHGATWIFPDGRL